MIDVQSLIIQIFDVELNNNNHLSPIFDSSLPNQQTEVKNRIKNAMKMKNNQAEIDLLQLKCQISAYDTFVSRCMRWNSINVIFDSNSSNKFKKQDQLYMK